LIKVSKLAGITYTIHNIGNSTLMYKIITNTNTNVFKKYQRH